MAPVAQPQKPLNIPLDKTTPIECEECKSQTFVEALMFRKASKFLTGSPQDSLVPIQTFACAKCGHVNHDFLPKGLTKEPE